MKTNLRALQVIWILGQGVFLPLVLWLDDLRISGQVGGMIGVFILLEGLYVVDAIFFLKLFKKEK